MSEIEALCEKHQPRPGPAQKFLDTFVSPFLSRLLWMFQLKQAEFPGIIGLEVTSICNLKCPMCPRTFSPRKFGHMPADMFKRLIDQIKPYDQRGLVEQVALNEYGEIFLHPQWFEMVEYTVEHIQRAKIRVDTNGTMMDAKVLERLFQSRLQSLIISIDGVDEASYNFLRAGGKFNQTVENVLRFIEKRKREPDAGPHAYLQIIESDITREHIESFRRFWAEKIGDAKRISVLVIPYHNFAGQIQDPKFQQAPARNRYVNTPCYRLTYELDIFSDGIATVCCMDSERQIRIGDAREKSLTEIWQGRALGDYRAAMRRSDYRTLPLCKTCPHSQKFLMNYMTPGSFGRLVQYAKRVRLRWVRGRFFDL